MFALDCSSLARAPRTARRAARGVGRVSVPVRPVSMSAENGNGAGNNVFNDARFGSKPLWQQIHLGKERDTSSPAEPIATSADDGAASEQLPNLDVPAASAPLWQRAHFKKDEPMWRKVNATRGADSPAVMLQQQEETTGGPKVLDVAPAAGPLWASVHQKRDEPSKMWQTVSETRDVAGFPWAKPAEPERAPVPQVPKSAPRGAATIAAAAKPNPAARNLIFAVVFACLGLIGLAASKSDAPAGAKGAPAAPGAAKAAVTVTKAPTK